MFSCKSFITFSTFPGPLLAFEDEPLGGKRGKEFHRQKRAV